MSEFLAAVQAGDVRTVQTLLGRQPALASSRDERGVSAVLVALHHGQARTLKALLAAAPDLDVFALAALGRANELDILLGLDPSGAVAAGADGYTALHLAARFGQGQAAEQLLAAGADPAALTDDGSDAAAIARQHGHDELALRLANR
jgi:ankyrin repeat protein